MASLDKTMAVAMIALMYLSGCGKAAPACKPGEVYSIAAGTARPGIYMVCKVLEVDKHGVWVCVFKDQFDHRPAKDEVSLPPVWVPMLFDPEIWAKSEPQFVNVVPTTQAELDHLEKTRPEVLKLYRPR